MPSKLFRYCIVANISTASVLITAMPASALVLNWSFQTTKGLVKGTVEGLIFDQDNQKDDIIVSVTDSPLFLGSLPVLFEESQILGGTGFSVDEDGLVTASIVLREYTLSGSNTIENIVLLQSSSGSYFVQSEYSPGDPFKILSRAENYSNPSKSLVIENFPIPEPVPAPLPILGAAAAFKFSRKLRRRCSILKNSKGVTSEI